MKELSSTTIVEVTFVAYNIYQQEGGNLFSNSNELLLLQALVIVIPHVLIISRGSQMMSVFTIYIYIEGALGSLASPSHAHELVQPNQLLQQPTTEPTPRPHTRLAPQSWAHRHSNGPVWFTLRYGRIFYA